MKKNQVDIDKLYLSLREFKKFVEAKTGISLKEFRSHPYIYEQENYKEDVRREGFHKLSYLQWKSDSFGGGAILDRVVSAIELERNNLVIWQDRYGPGSSEHSKLIKLRDKKDQLIEFEKQTYHFFYDERPHSDYFKYLTETLGKKYALIAYIYFLKDSEKYLPISTTNFDKLFVDLNVPISTKGNCSWENYQGFLGTISEVRCFLSEELTCDITLLDAHSFCWILTRQMRTENELAFLKAKSFRGGEKEKDAIIKARIGQGAFRSNLIRLWAGKCSIAEYGNEDFLIASHIKPWKDCTNEEAVDPNNGLLLTPNYDRAFDRGLVTFDDNGKIVISDKLTVEDKESLAIMKEARARVRLTEEQKRYMEYHRTNIYISK